MRNRFFRIGLPLACLIAVATVFTAWAENAALDEQWAQIQEANKPFAIRYDFEVWTNAVTDPSAGIEQFTVIDVPLMTVRIEAIPDGQLKTAFTAWLAVVDALQSVPMAQFKDKRIWAAGEIQNNPAIWNNYQWRPKP